ncbi:MAG: IS3 family transposase, partial [Clostridia bacterium]|nr:IS3 family transposase [Clostridia bacterium]
TSRDELITAIEQYLSFYNNKRYQHRLKCMTPMEDHRAAA